MSDCAGRADGSDLEDLKAALPRLLMKCLGRIAAAPRFALPHQNGRDFLLERGAKHLRFLKNGAAERFVGSRVFGIEP